MAMTQKEINVSLFDEVKTLQQNLRDFKLVLAIVNTSLDDPNCDIPQIQEMISEATKKYFDVGLDWTKNNRPF